MNKIKIFTLFLGLLLIAQSCRKDTDDITIIPPNPEPKISILSSVIGTVTDENGIAIEGAAVWFEDKSVFTDEFGVFQFVDETLYSSGTYIQVKREGYFNGSRKFYPSKGSTSIINIELIPLQPVADFSSSEGSLVTFEDVELNFKSKSIMREDGSEYTGNVNVAAKYLDPTLLSTLEQMPGDLTGVSSDQNRVILTSMAMIAVELYDDNGNGLQVMEGKTVDVKIPIPEELLSAAPNTIPMWHFDEEIGTWVEEGSADLVNGMYETSLGHFSFWNCDIPNDFIFLKGSIVNRGVPIQGVTVVVTEVDGGTSAGTTTDENGFFCGFVPNGIDLILEIFDQCGELLYSTAIPASEIDVTLDPINLFVETNVAAISGTVSLCEGSPSSQTFINVSQGDLNSIITIEDDFSFSGNIFYCDEDGEILIGAIDPINELASATSTFSASGDIDVGEIVLCEDQITPIVILEYGDVSISQTINPADTLVVSYSIQNIGDKELYTIYTIDWASTVVNLYTLTYLEGQPEQPATVELPAAGFSATGVAETTKVSQGGFNYLISTGTLVDIQVTNEDFYDPSYVDLFYYLAIEIE